MNEIDSVKPFTLQGGGEMGKRIREYDWSDSPVGSPDSWPISLRTSVNLLINSQFPMFVWWGKDLTTIYNDAYMQIAGDKHPGLLGKSGRLGWAEIWKDLAPLVDKVFKGEATWSEDLLLVMNRRGYFEETYFTFSYSPIIDESGKVGGLFCACVETTEKVLSKKQLLESEENLRNIILKAPVAMNIFKGPEFIVELANDRMFELWGKPKEDMLGKPIFDSLPEARGFGFEELMQKVYLTGEVISVKEQLVELPRNGNSEMVYVTVVYAPFKDGEGIIQGVITVALDVTEQVNTRKILEASEAGLHKRVEERTSELAAAVTELQRSNSHLEEFAHAASHDLKEPIRKIHFFMNMLKTKLDGNLDPESGNIFERVEQATHRMSNLIEDLLLYSHVSQKPLEKECIDLNDLTKHVLEDLEVSIEEKKAIIEVGKLPTVRGYKRQLQQLMQNLLTNALKYIHKDRIPEISIHHQIVAGSLHNLPGNQYHLISVKDNGIGFEQEHADRIFTMFQRLHGRAEYEGTGIGLSIVRKVAENHEGRITAKSQPGKGSVFLIYLPVN
jgi:PAS domain S-box-containing protein